MTDEERRHAVAVVGGATAGAEIAATLAAQGVEVFVFEMNTRPFGKIEDGLPIWHAALRKKEFRNIRAKLNKPGVHFLPCTKIGKDISLRQLLDDWGFSAVVLACGAWTDRRFPVAGSEAFVGRGLVYQNPFIRGFNRCQYEDTEAPRSFPSKDGAIVVGGGLASIDVAKVLMIETTMQALKARGIECDVEHMEKAGIPKTLAEHGLTMAELGLAGCTLMYRRRPEDMPLMAMPIDADETRRKKVEASRKKILAKATDKFGFSFEGLVVPKGIKTHEDQLTGVTFARVAPGEGRALVPTGEILEKPCSMVISSIGSIPEAIPGVKMEGELLSFSDGKVGRLQDFPNVFAAGNAVTGKGNIIASRRHAEHLSEALASRFLGLNEDREADDRLIDHLTTHLTESTALIHGEVEKLKTLDAAQMACLIQKARARQAEVGMRTGDADDEKTDLDHWLDKMTPTNLI